jgi:cytochrome c1
MRLGNLAAAALLACVLALSAVAEAGAEGLDAAKAGAGTTDMETGLIVAEGFESVKKNCTACHSARMVTQQRLTRRQWLEAIRWMQETQGLWEFAPETEDEILDYLSAHYAPPGTAAPVDKAPVK